MNNIVSWEFYSSLYDKVTQTDFPKAEAKAEAEVAQVIGPIRWAAITSDSFGFDVLKNAICKTIDLMADNEAAGLGKGVTSVSNDGYSESYAQADASDVRDELKKAIKEWLSGTGMVGAY